MKRIDAANHNANQFQDGDKSAGIKGTTVDASWLNAVQEEICSVVEAEGGALNAGDTSQLLAAIRKLSLPEGYIRGLNMSRAASDPDHDINIATGVAKAKGGVGLMDLSSPIVKRLDAVWAEGDGAGGRASGVSFSANSWYSVFLIGKEDGTVDAGFDSTTGGENLLADATDFDWYRRIGWVQTDATANIIPFNQRGDVFTWLAKRTQNLAASTTAANLTLPAPPHTEADFLISWDYSGGGGFRFGLATELIATDEAPVTDLFSFVAGHTSSSFHNRPPAPHRLLVSVNSAVRVRTDASSGTLRVVANGWTDTRDDLY